MKFREAESHTQHEAALSCKEVTSSLHSKPEGFCLDEQISETAHGSLSVEQFLLYTWEFYRVFHSYRWVRERMVIRINRRLTVAAVDALNEKFAALLAADRLVQTEALPEEAEETKVAALPRLVLTPHKRDFGMIRTLLDGINESETEDDEDAPGADTAPTIAQSDAPPAKVKEGF